MTGVDELVESNLTFKVPDVLKYAVVQEIAVMFDRTVRLWLKFAAARTTKRL